MKAYYILHINCDCCSHKEARTNLPKGKWGSARCKYCWGLLGLMEWKVIGKIKALGDLDALRRFELKNER